MSVFFRNALLQYSLNVYYTPIPVNGIAGLNAYYSLRKVVHRRAMFSGGRCGVGWLVRGSLRRRVTE